MTWDKLNPQGTPIIDRRQDETGEELSAEDHASNERDRLARRESVKLRIAECEMLLQHAALLQGEIARIDGETEAAAGVHSVTCGPLQIELSELEQAAISRIARREPPDKKEDDRRAEIIRLVEAENERLTEATERAKRLRQPLEGRIQKLQIEAAPLSALQNKLCQPPLGNPGLLAELFCSQQRSNYATARLAAAQKALAIISYNLSEIRAGRMGGPMDGQQFRHNNWFAEVAAATAELAEASRGDVRARMLDE